MKRGRFFWKLFLGNALLVAGVLLVCVWIILGEFERFHVTEVTPYLRAQAAALASLVADRLDASHFAELERVAKDASREARDVMRITFIAADGRVLGDSHADPGRMDNHLSRPEVQQALSSGWGESSRWSDTVSQQMKYVALRVGPSEATIGYIRVAVVMRSLIAQTQTVKRLIWGMALAALLAAVGLALGLAYLWGGRITRITAAARSLSRGDLSTRLNVTGADEVALLARSLNRMRDRLAGQLELIDRHRRVLESLLGQLHEGVIVAVGNGRIAIMNPAARRLLSCCVSPSQIWPAQESMTVEQCISEHELQNLLVYEARSKTISRGEAHERERSADSAAAAARDSQHDEITEIRLDIDGADGVRTLLARASDITLPAFGDKNAPARPRDPDLKGRLLVLTDITELSRALKMRSDFVTNASHELRTPVSAIRAAVETLLKMDLTGEADSAKRFIEVIARHSGRLEALSADLLDLSRVEAAGMKFRPASLRVMQTCKELYDRWCERMAEKRIQYSCNVGEDCTGVTVNPYLLQLVLDNLMDNAIKFTGPTKRITLTCRQQDGRMEFEVADEGCGIAPEEQERVFERFYQAAAGKAGAGGLSSRDRGTGLGLSIVRHAAAALDGTVRLESELGKGTRVTFAIPMARDIPARNIDRNSQGTMQS